MKTENEMKISFLSKSENEGFARTAVSAFAALCDPSVEELADVRTAVSEAVTNSVVHGYRGMTGTIEITARILSGNELYIRVKDKGCGIPDIEKAMEPLYTSAPFEERSGLGFSVMESFMDSLSVRSEVGHGTVITMRKKFGDADE